MRKGEQQVGWIRCVFRIVIHHIKITALIIGGLRQKAPNPPYIYCSIIELYKQVGWIRCAFCIVIHHIKINSRNTLVNYGMRKELWDSLMNYSSA